MVAILTTVFPPLITVNIYLIFHSLFRINEHNDMISRTFFFYQGQGHWPNDLDLPH